MDGHRRRRHRPVLGGTDAADSRAERVALVETAQIPHFQEGIHTLRVFLQIVRTTQYVMKFGTIRIDEKFIEFYPARQRSGLILDF